MHGQVTELQAEFDRTQEQHRHALADDQVEAGRKQVTLNGPQENLAKQTVLFNKLGVKIKLLRMLQLPMQSNVSLTVGS